MTITKWIIALVLTISLMFSVGIGVYAEENNGENTIEIGESA